MRFAAPALAVIAATMGGAFAAETKPAPEPDTYIFDVLALQPYEGNLARLVKSKGTPEWVKAISMKGEGTAVPAKTVDIGGTPYRLDHVCKPHDCAGHTLDVLWAPAGRKVWAVLVDQGKAPVMLGKPPAPQARALTEAATPVSPAATPPTPAPSPPTPAPATPPPPVPAAPSTK